MEIIGDRRFVEIPGDRTHELPPLLVRPAPEERLKRNPEKLERALGLAANIVESEDLINDFALDPQRMALEHDRRKMDLAITLVNEYCGFLHQWNWGNSVLEWIRQCETTFESRPDLRPLLRNDVWPHAGRSSFVRLLEDKAVPTEGVSLERAVGLRLTFRQPPPISCFSNQFLLYLNGSLSGTAYERWASMSPDPVSALPPERFAVQVVTM
jgi:hypothetical protein